MKASKISKSTVEKTPKNLAACVCANCPSYNDCSRGKEELLFCSNAVGKSACAYKMNGCLCGACPVHKEHELKSGYYCING